MKRVSEAVKQAVDGLRSEEQRLVAELASLKESEKGIQAELKRVQAGIQALTGEQSKTGASARPSLSDAQAMELVSTALQGKAPQSHDALKAVLMEHVKTKGLSGTGVHLTLSRVLKDGRFVEGPQGFKIK
jgi:hypothetical protein